MPQRAIATPLASTPKKRGRPTKPHRTGWGENVEGLRYRAHDKRWLVVGTGQMFREPDERLAVARFYAIQAERGEPEKTRVHVGEYPDTVQAVVAGLKEWGKGRKGIKTTRPKGDSGPVVVSVERTFDDPQYWGWLRQQLVTRAKWVSERVGIDLTNLKPPPQTVKLSALLAAYVTKPKLSANEITRSNLFWREFTKAVSVNTIGQVGHEQMAAYEKAVLAMGLSTKSDHHRFTKIKTIIAYGLKRGMDTEGCRRALDAAAMLDAHHRNENDPRPIDPAAFWKVYAAAEKVGDRSYTALLLMALNCCCYGGEVASILWSQVDLKVGTYVGRRPKTGVSRVAVLWPEVITALKKIPKRDGVDAIFNTSIRSHTILSVLRAWRRYRNAAGYGEELTFGQIRDAAYSIACQSGTLDQAKALAGHRFPGMADAYVRRRPDFVGPACNAIRRAFKVAKYGTFKTTFPHLD